jgi:hypothetical protein
MKEIHSNRPSSGRYQFLTCAKPLSQGFAWVVEDVQAPDHPSGKQRQRTLVKAGPE